VTSLRPRQQSIRSSTSTPTKIAQPKINRLKDITEITVPILLLILERILEFNDDKVLCESFFFRCPHVS
jgi:hypothetical protein